jgi:ribosomal-protein-alanine N-acetyltransferase
MIRRFRESDVKEVMEIEENSFPKSPYNRFTFLYHAKTFPDCFLVYEHKGKVIGYVLFFPDGHIASIVVHSAYRRKGIGTKLVKEVLKRTNSKARVEVRESNEVARKFYKKLGFKTKASIPWYYGSEHALLMVRE